MRPVSLVNEILPFVIRALETNDASLIADAQDHLRPNLTEWLDAETNELVENLDLLLAIAEEKILDI